MQTLLRWQVTFADPIWHPFPLDYDHEEWLLFPENHLVSFWFKCISNTSLKGETNLPLCSHIFVPEIRNSSVMQNNSSKWPSVLWNLLWKVGAYHTGCQTVSINSTHLPIRTARTLKPRQQISFSLVFSCCCRLIIAVCQSVIFIMRICVCRPCGSLTACRTQRVGSAGLLMFVVSVHRKLPNFSSKPGWGKYMGIITGWNQIRIFSDFEPRVEAQPWSTTIKFMKQDWPPLGLVT